MRGSLLIQLSTKFYRSNEWGGPVFLDRIESGLTESHITPPYYADLGGPGQLDRTEVELSESPAAPANDTSVWSIGDFLARTAPFSPTSVTWWNTSAGVR